MAKPPTRYTAEPKIAIRQIASINSELSHFSGRPKSEVALPINLLRVISSILSSFRFLSSRSFFCRTWFEMVSFSCFLSCFKVPCLVIISLRSVSDACPKSRLWKLETSISFSILIFSFNSSCCGVGLGITPGGHSYTLFTVDDDISESDREGDGVELDVERAALVDEAFKTTSTSEDEDALPKM